MVLRQRYFETDNADRGQTKKINVDNKNGVNLVKDEGIRDTLIDLHNCEVFRTRRGRNTRINRRG